MSHNPFKIQEGSIRDAKVSGFVSGRQSGDHVDFDSFGKFQRLGKFFGDKKINILFFVFFAFIVILFLRAFYLQGISGDYYRGIAEGNRIRSDIIRANRGLIYDRFGEPLVKNVSYFFLYIKPKLLPEDDLLRMDLLDDLVDILSLEKGDLENRIYENIKKSDKSLVYENLPYELALKLMIMSEENPSIEVSYEPRRQYFTNYGLAHALGYLGEVSEDDIRLKAYNYHDRIGKTGLEYVYQDVLKGQNGIRQVEVDALFREKNIISMTEPVDGEDLILTIDAKAQEKLYEIMRNVSEQYNKPKMAAVVLDAKDGGVLAVASLPAYDNNIFTTVLNTDEYNKIISDVDTPLLNRAISGAYPLGSVFKPIIAAGALQEEIVNDNFTVDSVGGITVGDRFFPDWRPGGHGRTDIYWALADSVNTYFYSVGGGNNQWLSLGLGSEKIIEYATKFGLGKTIGIDDTNEASGFLPSKEWKEETFGERWYLGDTYNLSIGQGYMLATPLQAATMMSYFANNGLAYKPHFIKETKNGDKITPYEPQVFLTNIISSDNLNIIRKGLRMTVTDGTAKSMQSVAVKVAAKTGTAQFRNDKTPHSWLAAFAPYDDAKLSLAILVEEGGDIGVAVVVARQFMEWYFSQ
ncbi:penicillin-binding protein 2 [Candidatus Parcubacteria bacterium]|nr:MAG: penicillin-binding protein 2 [Candidatus Parcubacteria bacterium]